MSDISSQSTTTPKIVAIVSFIVDIVAIVIWTRARASWTPYFFPAVGALTLVFAVSFVIAYIRQPTPAASLTSISPLGRTKARVPPRRATGMPSGQSSFNPGIEPLNAPISPAPTISATPSPASFKPHIEVSSEYFVQPIVLDGPIIRKSTMERTHTGYVIQFENTPKPPRKIDIPQNVYARISYEPMNREGDIAPTHLHYACWMDQDGPFVDFPLKTPRYLVIGAREYDPVDSEQEILPLSFFGYSFETDKPIVPVNAGSGAWAYLLKVDLTMGESVEWTEHFEFEFEYHEDGTIRLDYKKPLFPKPGQFAEKSDPLNSHEA
jgi:hypothetical protein